MNHRIDDLLKLITGDTLRRASAGVRTPLIASESDKGRIVNSAAFRRLQQKAQVFPLDTNAAVRTRLTHSIEVSQLGRYLAQKVIDKLGASEAAYRDMAPIMNVVENACLLHDIGNPPFGHLGEAAIREWFCANSPKDCDLREFDGNPQGFRLISLLSGKDSHGMNLTCSLLLSTVKYPWTARLKLDRKKIGVFDMEWQAYSSACGLLGWEPGKRFPFLLLMEAADDIAYSMSDLEDGLEKKIVDLAELKSAFGQERFVSSSVHEMVAFKTGVINGAVESAADSFSQNLDDILAGNPIRLLPSTSEFGDLLDKVKTFAKKRIYSHPSAERVELAGRSVVSGLLAHFKLLLDLDSSCFSKLLDGDTKAERGLEFQARLLRLLPENYREKYLLNERGAEADRRRHLIVDFIAGMTDDYALETFQVLQGIRIR